MAWFLRFQLRVGKTMNKFLICIPLAASMLTGQTAPVAPAVYHPQDRVEMSQVYYHRHHRRHHRRVVVVHRRSKKKSAAIIGGSAAGGAAIGALAGGGKGAAIGALAGGAGGFIYDRATHKKKRVVTE
jgi:uncharacterized protein YcfJ